MGGRGGTRGKASGAGGGTKTVTTKTGSNKQYDVYQIQAMQDGKKIGQITVRHYKKDGTVVVLRIDSSVKGTGRKLYAQAMIKAKSLGATKFSSDDKVSAAAQKSWSGLKRSGITFTENASRTQKSGIKETLDGKPLYTVDLGKVSQRRVRKILGGG